MFYISTVPWRALPDDSGSLSHSTHLCHQYVFEMRPVREVIRPLGLVSLRQQKVKDANGVKWVARFYRYAQNMTFAHKARARGRTNGRKQWLIDEGIR